MQYEGDQEQKQGGGEHDLKSQFMSTAPVKITYGNSTYNKHFMNIKETKQELKTYSRQLEEALYKCRQKYIEIEKDNEILNKTYLRELKKGDRMQQALMKVKVQILSLFNSKLYKLCPQCSQIKELVDLQNIIKERVFDVSNEGE